MAAIYKTAALTFLIFPRMNIVFMGTPEFAAQFLLHLRKGPHRILSVVTQPDRPAGRGRVLTPPPVKTCAQELGYPVLQPESVKDPGFSETLSALHADLFVVVAFSILPKAVLAASKLGAVNVHGSLLPKYRGAAPVQWAIADGNAETGVSVFLLDDKMDHGPLLEQRKVAIADDDTTATLLDKMVAPGCDALDCALGRIGSGNLSELPAQEHAFASPAPKIKKENGRLDFSHTAKQLHDQIRAFSPWPGGYASFMGKTAYLRKTVVAQVPFRLAPGEVRIGNGHLYAGTADGVLEIIEIQLEGKRSMSVREFLPGLHAKDALCFKTIA